MSLFTGDMHSGTIVHSVAHDACGYAKRFHDVGPGYNYLGVSSPLSATRIVSFFTKEANSRYDCQLEGLLQTHVEMFKQGILGKKGRMSRKKEMLLRYQAMCGGERKSENPEQCSRTEADIKEDYKPPCKLFK